MLIQHFLLTHLNLNRTWCTITDLVTFSEGAVLTRLDTNGMVDSALVLSASSYDGREVATL